MIVVIPTRKRSKGFPKKNQILFDYTAQTIYKKFNVIVTSNDDKILEKSSREYGFTCLYRKEELCNDETTSKEFMLDVIEKFNISEHEFILMLYLTYPERTLQDIENFIDFFFSVKSKSILCRKNVKTHPYLCIYEDGSQVIKHNLCRRQDYPQIFEISHFMQGALAGEYKNLNNNLYNENTSYYFINDKIDIDLEEDYIKFLDEINK